MLALLAIRTLPRLELRIEVVEFGKHYLLNAVIDRFQRYVSGGAE